MPDQQDYSYLYNQQPVQQGDPNKTKRIIIGVVGLTIFIFGVIIVVILLLSGPDVRNHLGAISAKQQEVVRVAELGQKNSRTRQATKNFAATTQVVGSSHLFSLTSLVDDKYGQPLADSKLKSAQNDSIDSTLDEAERNNQLDEKLIEILDALLEDVNQEIRNRASEIEDEETLAALNTVVAQNELLIESIE